MTIDTSGRWWTGDSPDDLREYLRAYASDAYEVDEFRLAACDCGGRAFRLEFDSDEGVARRTCVACKTRRYLCDSEEHHDGGRLATVRCPTCKGREVNVAVAFALHAQRTAIRWIYVGSRCIGCGVLSCLADWKVGYEPSLQLIDQV